MELEWAFLEAEEGAEGGDWQEQKTRQRPRSTAPRIPGPDFIQIAASPVGF